MSDDWPILATVFDIGRVGAQPASRTVIVAYDDIFSVKYHGRNLPPYWRSTGSEAEDMLQSAWKEYPELKARCARFDDELVADLVRVGGPRYAALAALAYRQVFGGCKIAATPDGAPLMFCKENSSNGCASTVDVIYPMSPFFLLLNPEMLRLQLMPLLEYASSGKWKYPFAPHDLGTYPQVGGQVYGGAEQTEADQMPVEESGNMVIMAAAPATKP